MLCPILVCFAHGVLPKALGSYKGCALKRGDLRWSGGVCLFFPGQCKTGGALRLFDAFGGIDVH